MEATAPRFPLSYLAAAGLTVALVLGVLSRCEVDPVVQIGSVMLVLLGLLMVLRRTR